MTSFLLKGILTYAVGVVVRIKPERSASPSKKIHILFLY
jgi:hypothetical protein